MTGNEIEIFIFIGIFVAYVLPSLIARYREHHQLMPIFLVNVLLGWTVLGWVGALVWSVSAVRYPADQG